MLSCASDEPARINVRNSSMAPLILTYLLSCRRRSRCVARFSLSPERAISTPSSYHMVKQAQMKTRGPV